MSFCGVRTSSLARNGTSIKNKRNNCTGLSLGLSPCESQRAPKRFSLWSSNSFRMRIVISMTIESKDFLQRYLSFFIANHAIYGKTCIGLSLRFLTCFVIRSYHVISFGGVRTSSLARNGTSIKNKRNNCTGVVNIMKKLHRVRRSRQMD